jgi:hypothetical protein
MVGKFRKYQMTSSKFQIPNFNLSKPICDFSLKFTLGILGTSLIYPAQRLNNPLGADYRASGMAYEEGRGFIAGASFHLPMDLTQVDLHCHEALYPFSQFPDLVLRKGPYCY